MYRQASRSLQRGRLLSGTGRVAHGKPAPAAFRTLSAPLPLWLELPLSWRQQAYPTPHLHVQVRGLLRDHALLGVECETLSNILNALNLRAKNDRHWLPGGVLAQVILLTRGNSGDAVLIERFRG